jgi:hypothetical protein
MTKNGLYLTEKPISKIRRVRKQCPVTGLKFCCNLNTHVNAACLLAERVKYSCPCARSEGAWELEVQLHAFLTMETVVGYLRPLYPGTRGI